MDMLTTADMTAAKALMDECLTAAREVAPLRPLLGTVKKSGRGLVVKLHSAFVGSRVVADVDAALAFAKESDDARLAGVTPRELRFAGTPCPVYLPELAPDYRLPERFRHILPPNHPMR